MDNTIYCDSRWLSKLVWRDKFKESWLDPDDEVTWIQGAFDVFDPHFALREVGNEHAGSKSFITSDAKVVEGDGTILEMKTSISSVHPDAAKSSSLQGDGAVSFPSLWGPARTVQGETDRRRPAPLPLTKEST